MKISLCLVAAALLAAPGCSKKKTDESSPSAAKTVETPAATPAAPAAKAAPLPYVDPGAPTPESVTKAVAVLAPTQGREAHGVIQFAQAPGGGVDVTAEIEGLPPGKHGYHIHVLGDCSSPDGKSAGTHFNFAGSSMKPAADIKRITGNLGELDADKEGKAMAKTHLDKASLQGPYSLIGRSVIIHEKGNDPAQPPIGAAGARLACGVIGIGQ